MAYVSQEFKKSRTPDVKAILQKYGLKGSLSVHNHSTLVLTIKSGAIDFISNFNEIESAKSRPAHLRFGQVSDYIDVNVYWFHEHFSGTAKDCLTELIAALKGPDYYDKSDSMSDYFCCSHYVDIHIGRWDKPYVYNA